MGIVSAQSELRDHYQRPLTDLRISVTDRCNLRCTYCMPKKPNGERYNFLPKEDLLSFNEITRVVNVLAQKGLQKIRITGGEPLLRKDLDQLIASIKSIDGIKEVALTTNGVFLSEQIDALVDAGLDRVTLSLDAIDQDLLNRISGRTVDLEKVYAGLDATLQKDLKLKVNTVIQRGVNDDHFMHVLQRFRGTAVEVRLIEFMDVGGLNQWQLDKVVPSRELIQKIEQKWPLEMLGRQQSSDVANRYRYADGQGTLGFISSISQPFCGHCSRARLSSEGILYTCLFANTGLLIRDKLRDGLSDDELQELLTQHWQQRRDRYSEERMTKPGRAHAESEKIEMFYIGG
ncbi:MAG: GTP 3',8-cyclase MoaA [Gammaproteobacteria bacterium]|nr:GTP 3',8-cyclase MoaA [Gammaproteobacteria bacterium]NNC98366.1 GTP 3',8-cyclase MoaA [Gammaproteobacteria bacterium]